MRVFIFCIALVACGANEPPASPATATPATPGGTYDLHEWGLVSVSPGNFEIAAGPGMRVELLTVDKPVLYFHSTTELDVRVKIKLGEGIAIVEHWPPMSDGAWQVHATPEACTTPRSYPSACSSPDGYCETAELALYETDDAACLDTGSHQLPLLFYRVRAATTPVLPLEVRRDDEDLVVRNASWRNGLGALWRVVWDGNTGVTHASRVDVPAIGEEARLPRATTGGANPARAAIRADLAQHGLSAPETSAFMRAWDTALFGPATNDSTTPTDEDTDNPPSDRRGDGDGTVVDELSIDGIPTIRGGPRIADMLLYWLPQDAIETLARVEATPPPRHLRRAMLVRVDARQF